ncbi:MAG: hypothetical protein JJE42_07015 [Burkholderiales bacterium]|nr:hypothetical protein [Burkholderiales bacterium]
MNWEAFSAISSAVATLAITMSVIYLAIQVKTSTKATNSQTYQFATQALGEMASIIGVSKDLARIYVNGMADPESLDKEEYYQFSYLTVSLFRRYENIFYQWQSGMIDEDFWGGHRNNLLWFYFQPGTQRWWSERRGGFSDRFRSFLDKSTKEDYAAQPRRFY